MDTKEQKKPREGIKSQKWANFTTWVVCLSFLSFQSWQIFSQFSKGNIVTNIMFVTSMPDTLPAITVCMDEIFSFEKVAKRLPEYDEVFNQYKQFLAKTSKLKEKEVGATETNENNNFYKQYYYIFYEISDILQENDPDNIFEQHFIDVFDNLTLPYTRSNIDVSIDGNIHRIEQPNQYLTFDNSSRTFYFQPVESIVFRRKQKCFTFFSFLQWPFRNFKIVIKEIVLKITFLKHWFPFDPHKEIYIAIHSPNTVPGNTSLDIR